MTNTTRKEQTGTSTPENEKRAAIAAQLATMAEKIANAEPLQAL